MKTKHIIFCALIAAVLAVTVIGCSGKGASNEAHVTVSFVVGEQTEEKVISKGGKVSAIDEGKWYTDPEMTQEYDFGAEVQDDLKLYGKSEFTVKFVGEGITDQQTIKRGEKLGNFPRVTEKEGKTAVWQAGSVRVTPDTRVYGDYEITLSYADAEYKVSVLDYYGEEIYSATVEYGEDVDLSGVENLVPHRYSDFYTFAGWDSSVENITKDTVFKPTYWYNSLPEEIFDFLLLDDGTYGIELKGHRTENYSKYNFKGCLGLPEQHNGKPVTVLLPRGFYTDYSDSWLGMEKLLVPSSYKRIMGEGFYCMQFNGEVIFAEGVEEIYADAFCTAKQGSGSEPFVLKLPSTLTYIEKYAFADFWNGRITLEDGEHYIWRNNAIYTADGKTLVFVQINDPAVTEFTIEEEVEELYPCLFTRSRCIEKVTIKGDREDLSTCTFYSPYALKELKIEGKVKKIYGTEKTYDVIGYGEFLCEGKEATIEVEAMTWLYRTAGLEEFTLPEGLEYIGDSAFYDFMDSFKITELHIGKEFKHMGDGAFITKYLQEITVDPANPDFYGENCLIKRGGSTMDDGDRLLMYACASDIADFNIPQGVTSFGPMVFDGANNLETLTIPEGVTKIPVGFLSQENKWNEDYTEVIEPTKLKKISFPSTLNEIGWYDPDFPDFIRINTTIFAMDSPLEIEFPRGNNVEKIAENSFVCAVETVELGAKCTNYETNGYSSQKIKEYKVDPQNTKYASINKALYEIISEDNGKKKVSLLAWPVISDVTEITEQTLLGEDSGKYTITKLSDAAFYYNQSIIKVDLPEGITEIGNSAFGICPKLQTVVLPQSLLIYGEGVFFGCENLKTLEFKSENPPEFVYMGMSQPFGWNIVDEETWDMTFTVGDIKVKIPTGNDPMKIYDAYHKALSKFGEDFCKAISTENIQTTTYKFVTNGGTAIGDIENTVYLYSRPFTKWSGEGEVPNFLGWYTKNGLGEVGDAAGTDKFIDAKELDDEAWGERIPFVGDFWKGTPNGSGEEASTCTLYARWSRTYKITDGSYPEHAFEVSTDAHTSVKFVYKTEAAYYFKFTTDQAGNYDLSWDTTVLRPQCNMMCFSYADNGVLVPVPYGRTGFRCEANKTYYFIMQFFSDEDWEKDYEFWVSYLE